MKELFKLEIDASHDYAITKDKILTLDQKLVCEILMKNGYFCKIERYLPENTGFWRNRIVVCREETP